MQKIELNKIINISIIVWVLLWLYFLLFNWKVFSINLDTNLGFTVVGGYPFIFFFLIGLLFLILIKYFDHLIEMKRLNMEKGMENKIALLEKDIELLKLKESFVNKLSEEVTTKASNMNALYNKLYELTEKLMEIKIKENDKLSGENESNENKDIV